MPEGRYIFRDLSYARPVSQFVGSVDVLTPINKLQAIKDQADLIGGFIKPDPALDPDLNRSRERHSFYKNKLDEITNYEPHEQLRAARKLAQMYVDDEERKSIVGNYNAEQAFIKNQTDRFNKGEITEEALRKSIEISRDRYKTQDGIGVKDPVTGAYRGYNAYTPSEYRDLNKQALDTVQGWMADGTVSQPKLGKDGAYWVNYKGKEVKFNEVYTNVLGMLRNDEKNKAYVKDLINFETYGKDLNSLDRDSLEKAVTQIAPVLGISTKDIKNMSNKDLYNHYKEFSIYNDSVSGAANKAAFKDIDSDWKFDPAWEAAQRKLGDNKAEEMLNPASSINDVINNPYSLPEITSVEGNMSFDDYAASKGLWSNPLWTNPGPAPTGTRKLNGKVISNAEYFDLKKKYEKEYSLLKSDINTYVNSKEVKAQYGDLPAQIAASIPKGDMSNEAYKQLVLSKINEAIKSHQTQKITIDEMPVEQAEKETLRYFGDVRQTEKGTTGGLGVIDKRGIWHNGKLYNLETLAKELNTTPAQLASTGRVTGRARPDNPIAPSAVSASLLDGNGNYIKVFIDRESEQAAKVRNPLHKLSAPLFNLSLDKSETTEIEGRKIVSKPVDIWVDPSGNQIAQYKDTNGNFVSRRGKTPAALDTDTKYSHRIVLVEDQNDPDDEPVVYRIDDEGKVVLDDIIHYTDAIDVFKNPAGVKSISSQGKANVEN